jgi:hypothetical protein
MKGDGQHIESICRKFAAKEAPPSSTKEDSGGVPVNND